MKKLLFSAYDLGIGGIENALINLLNALIEKEYAITLVLEHKRGEFLAKLDQRIQVITYTPSEFKNPIIRKTINLGKRIRFILRYYHQFDFAGAFTTYSRMSCFVARVASKNNALWGHADYLSLYYGNIEEVKAFFNVLHYEKFKNIIFVSEKSKESFIDIFPQMKERTIYCNNLINIENVKKLAQEQIEIKRENVYTFVNIGRHDERQKRLSRLIEAASRLKKEQINFRIIMIGNGPDTKKYEEMIKERELEKEILLLGSRKNPYPYIKIADAVILTSDYEGYPVIFLESFILQKPILTTDISDAKKVIAGKYGEVVKKDTKAIYEKMKHWIQTNYSLKEVVDMNKQQEQTFAKLEKLF